MKSSRRSLCIKVVGVLTALALAGESAYAQSVALPGTGDADAQTQDAARLQVSELEAQRARSKERAAEWQTRADAFEQSAADAPSYLLELARDIKALEVAEPPLSLSSVPSSELEVRILSREQDLALAQREASELTGTRERRPERRRELPELLAGAKSRLSALEQSPPLTPGNDALGALQQEIAQLRKTALENEVRSHELELSGYEARGKVLEARIQRANLQMARSEAQLKQLRIALAAERDREAELVIEQAMASIARVESLGPEVQEAVRRLAAENSELARGRTGENGLLEAIDDVSEKLIRADQRVSAIEADYQRLSERLHTTGLSDSLGLLLRKTRSEMPDVGKYSRFIRMRQQQIAEVQDQQTRLREALNTVRDVEGLVGETVKLYAGSLSEFDRERFTDVMRDLLSTKQSHLISLLADNESYFQKLVDFDARQQELIEKTNQLLAFIDERILWVPSGSTVRASVFGDSTGALLWLSSATNWAKALQATHAVFQETFYLSALGLIGMLAMLVALPRRVAPFLADLKSAAQHPMAVDVLPTLQCLGLSLLLVPWGPAVLGFIGWRLGLSSDATLFVRSIAGGLLAAGWMWLSLEVPRQLLRRNGLAEAHFNWPADAVRRLSLAFSWLAAFAVPLVFVIQTLEVHGDELWRESLGRLSLIALLLAVTVVSHHVMRPAGALRLVLRAIPSIRVSGALWHLLHFTAVALPLGLAFAAARGYFWTSLQLGMSYHLTLLFLFLLFFAFLLSLRWSALAGRRVAFRLATEKRETERLARLQADPNSLSPEAPPLMGDDVDLAKVDEQTQRLLVTTMVVAMGIGLWFLWVEVVPAFGFLETVEVWTSTESVTVESTGPDGTRIFETEERLVPFTLANLLVAVLVAFMTLVLVRNLPGLLEISLFRHLGTSKGERYAYTTITKYAVTVVGGVLAFNAVGIGWENIQWLVAAVGLGLGFGLQEIFANFIAGLIILFERPIRVGDTVTIGNISGTVSKIRIRATWITAFDRKELVVPNKEFVTSQLVNWSLSDPILRVEIPVGIAYGSDTELAMRELHAVARANPHILSDPHPDVLFLGFGDSSLNFELRVYSPDIEHRVIIQHSLHLAIDQAFRKAGIEIAFPQRDIHIRSTPQLPTPPEPGEA